MQRKNVLFMFGSCLWLVGPHLNAQSVDLDVQQFEPAPGGDQNYTHVHGAGVLGTLKPSIGLYLNYAYRPLELTLGATDTSADLIHQQAQADVVAALGLGHHLQLGLALPVTLFQTAGPSNGLTIPPVASRVLGDIRIVPKWQILGSNRPDGSSRGGLALEGIVTLPTGSPQNYQGNGGVTFEPRAVIDLPVGDRLRAGLNLGYRLRKPQGLYDLIVGNELTYGAGLSYDLSPQRVALMAEVYGRAAAGPGTVLETETVPLEADLALRWHVAGGHALTFGGGPGLLKGYGTPTFRAFLGYTFTGRTTSVIKVNDRDGDGISDEYDQCPDEPEDKDGFDDADGCPDLDNDKDGIQDKQDKCPNDAEDLDSFEDTDGCPDLDNDKDGIQDAKDRCPNDPEDKDSFEDTDGCPDPDNDKDGILDAGDTCPNEPEDKDGFQDEDGCPDLDNDKDGIPDAKDRCPNVPETINGFEDEDGCPDKGKSSVKVTSTEIEILQRVYFDTDRSTIKAESNNVLGQVVSVLRAHTEITLLKVGGHTDNVGNAEYNLKLSGERATAVGQFLIDHGIDARRLSTEGFGLTRPVAKNSTASGRAKNRRVQFTIEEIDGKPVPTPAPTSNDAK